MVLEYFISVVNLIMKSDTVVLFHKLLLFQRKTGAILSLSPKNGISVDCLSIELGFCPFLFSESNTRPAENQKCCRSMLAKKKNSGNNL